MTDKTKHQVSRFLDKVADKFPAVEAPTLFTDIHVHASPDTGDLMAYDDDGKEITRCVVEEWIERGGDVSSFWQEAEVVMRTILAAKKPCLGLTKPYSFILEDEGGNHVAELYVVDDSETVIISTPFMDGMEKDLDDFFDELMKE